MSKKAFQMMALGSIMAFALLCSGCVVADGGYYGSGLDYGYGPYAGPYYGGYGPYYGDNVVIGTGYSHRGYYGGHHLYRASSYRGGRNSFGGRQFNGGRNFGGRRAAIAPGRGNFNEGSRGGGQGSRR